MKKIMINLLKTAMILSTIGIAQAEVAKVTAETFIRAETDNMYAAMIKNAGGTNKFFHFRSPTPLDKQTVVRMNRDVLYSGGVFDAKDGLSVQFPKLPDDRYASVYVIDNDHYVTEIIHEPGIHQIKGATRFLYLIVRIQVKDAFDKKEIEMINTIQDKFIVTSKSGEEFPGFKWDRASLDTLRAEYEKDKAANYPTYKGMMGKRGTVNEKTRHIAAATGWGLLPDEEASYLGYASKAGNEGCQTATYSVPDNKAFWSITVYGNDGFMKSDNNVLNGANTKLNDDGMFTAYFGSKEACGDVENRVDVSEGWNFLMRIYQPGESVLDGTYKLPTTKPVKK